ncbi:helix-turn-helix domain-containing protein, partial [Ruegeria sp. SCPT10]|uniref:helix-turn-helix domain-containing protein n=1 Tax=Ruegeria sp. SCP10 TaxID=3141377 RepID=UPI0033370261
PQEAVTGSGNTPHKNHSSKVTPEVFEKIKALRDQGLSGRKISAALKEDNIQISHATISRALRADAGLSAEGMPKAVTRDVMQIILDLKSQKYSSQAISKHLEAGGIHLSESGVVVALRVASSQFNVTADSESWRSFRETGYQQASPDIQHML